MVVENRSEGLTEPQTTPRNLLHSQDRSASTPEGLAGEPVRAVSLAVLSTGPSRRQQSMLPLLEKSSHFPHNGESTVSGKVDPSLYPIKTRTAKSAKGAKRQSCRRKSLNRRRRALQHREDNLDRTRDWMAVQGASDACAGHGRSGEGPPSIFQTTRNGCSGHVAVTSGVPKRADSLGGGADGP